MQRREFLGKMVGTSSAVLSLDGLLEGEETGFEKRAREYLRSIMSSRQRIEDFITGQYGPRDKPPGEIFQYDSELGWIHHEVIGSAGVDGSKVFYSYDSDGARKVINFFYKPSRIRTYGNSFTHCSQANNNETWEEYLTAHIQEPVRKYGVGGHSVYQAYRRMLKVKKQTSGGYIILNIWDNDHYRNLDAWRSIRFGYGSRCGFKLPHLRVNVAQGSCKQIENILKTPKDLYKICDEDYLWRTFKDDPILKMVIAAREGGRNISAALINPVTVSFGIPDEKIADTETAKKIKKIHTEAAQFATQNIATWAEEFARDTRKKMMIMLSSGRGNVAKHLSGEPRFDQGFADWLKDKPYPVIDMRDVFAADYKEYKVDIDQYLAPFYYGHHTPRGNFFPACVIKDRVIQWLNPYQQTVMGGLKYNHIRNPWPGHDGLPSWHKDDSEKPTFDSGHGIGNNYWDILPFGWDDLYVTNQYYAATLAMAQMEEAIQQNPGWNVPSGTKKLDPRQLRRHASQVKKTANRLFWNKQDGRFIACIDKNDNKHDYGYTFLNLDAIWYDLANRDHARQIIDWISSRRIVAGDTSRGKDIYRWRFGPRATTHRNIEWYGQDWWAPESPDWGYRSRIVERSLALPFMIYGLG